MTEIEKLYYQAQIKEHLSDRDYIALMLEGETSCGVTAIEAANELVETYGTLATAASRSLAELERVRGITPLGALRIKLLEKAELQIKKARFVEYKEVIRTLDDFYKIGVAYYANIRYEKMIILLLDFEYHLIRIEGYGHGDTHTAIADMGKLLSLIQMHNPRNVVIYHNHFSNANPSVEDINFTNNLNIVLDMFGIYLADHIVVCRDACCSMRKNGYITELPKKPLKGF